LVLAADELTLVLAAEDDALELETLVLEADDEALELETLVLEADDEALVLLGVAEALVLLCEEEMPSQSP
jgi:hypothetical protein